MKTKIESLYLSYVNDFLSVDRFAEYYSMSTFRAHKVIKIGRKLNHRKSKV